MTLVVQSRQSNCQLPGSTCQQRDGLGLSGLQRSDARPMSRTFLTEPTASCMPFHGGGVNSTLSGTSPFRTSSCGRDATEVLAAWEGEALILQDVGWFCRNVRFLGQNPNSGYQEFNR